MPDSHFQPRFVPEVAAAATAGLQASPKTLPSKLFYDDVGCALFGRITELPEYYITRVEIALLKEVAPQVASLAPVGATVVEYGAGSEDKAAILLDALRDPRGYVPIDVAGEALHASAQRLGCSRPDLSIWPIEADFLKPVPLPPALAGAGLVGFFPGSTIGNLEPPVAVLFLRQARLALGPDALFLIGADLEKSPDVLLPAYDDAAGVTAEFNLNLLTRLNREAAADFVLDAFAHRAVWNADEGRIEMHLVSLAAQSATVGGRPFTFYEGETIHTENSYKHTPERFARIAGSAGWRVVRTWTDSDDLFGIYLLRADG